MAEVDPSTTLATLSSTLSTLESSLEPLLATPFETLCSATNQDGSELDPLLKARLEILTGYVVHDLIWIYCRTAGVDPNSHPVLAELLRLRSYFDKLKSAESSSTAPTEEDDRTRPTLDKAAAGRFIRAAISSSRPRTPIDYTPSAGPSTAEERGEKGRHTRFSPEVEGEVEKLLDSGEESGEEEEESPGKKVKLSTGAKEEGGKKAQAAGKRPKMDPFAGYDSPKTKKSSSKKSSGASTPTGEKRKRTDAAAEVESPAVSEKSAGGDKGKKVGKKDKLRMKKDKGGK